MTDNPPALIFDIGMNIGDNSAYYLHCGYDVVGVEANPDLAAHCTARFSREIGDGRMSVIGAGVLATAGEFTFYRNLADHGHSSFDKAMGTRGEEYEAIAVRCITLDSLIQEHGRPLFIKVDVEGMDLQVLESLRADSSPNYLSVELSSFTDPILERLIDLGYLGFKFVNGATFRATRPIFDHNVGWRLLRRAGRLFTPVRTAICALPDRFRPDREEWAPPGKHSPDGYPFTAYGAGPFGELAAGEWRSPAAALRWFSALAQEYRKARKEEFLWYDVHARHARAPAVTVDAKGKLITARL